MVRTGDEGPKGISCLVIEKDMAGVSFGAQERKLGWHSQPTAQVNFDGVRVPVENLVGGEGEGFRIAMMGLDGVRASPPLRLPRNKTSPRAAEKPATPGSAARACAA